MKKLISSKLCCGSCAHFLRHYVPLRGPRDNQFIKCSYGHCRYGTENSCHLDRTAPCVEYQTGYEPIVLRLKRHAFQK